MKESEARQHRRHEDGYPVQQIASDTFQIRRAIAQDADIISWHRARMFQDMGDVSGDAFEILRAKARTRLEQWIDNRNYIGLLTTSVDEPETIVAGAGVQLRAPHGGIFVFFAISGLLWFVVALIAGTVVGALAVTALKSIGHSDAEDAPEDAVDLEHAHTPVHAPARAAGV